MLYRFKEVCGATHGRQRSGRVREKLAEALLESHNFNTMKVGLHFLCFQLELLNFRDI